MVILRIVTLFASATLRHSPLMMKDKELALKPSGRATFSTGMSFSRRCVRTFRNRNGRDLPYGRASRDESTAHS